MDRISGKTHSKYLTGKNDEWDLLENTLDQTHNNLEHHVKDLHLQNEKLSKLMESISDSILAINLDYEILFANNQFKTNFLPPNYRPKALSNAKLQEMYKNKEILDLFILAMEEGKSLNKNGVSHLINPTNKPGFFDIKISLLKDSQGSIFGAICVFHEVTERKLAEQMREEFAANVSHEVRTPLTAIKGYIQILRSRIQFNTLEIETIFSKLEKNSERLAALFKDLLNLNVIETKNTIEKETISTEDLTQNVLVNVSQTYLNKNVSISVNNKKGEVWGNSLLVEQVLTNLIDNAYKYTSHDGTISIFWEEEDDQTILKVNNSGPVIGKEHLPRLFERFYRVDPSRSREQGGTGLGLAIVKHVVQKHQGQIYVNSSLESGTTFRITFPNENSPFTNLNSIGVINSTVLL